jgi:hypothetical protein
MARPPATSISENCALLEIERCLLDLGRAAALVNLNPIYAPLFIRAEQDLAAAEALLILDPIARARAIIAGSKVA